MTRRKGEDPKARVGEKSQKDRNIHPHHHLVLRKLREKRRLHLPHCAGSSILLKQARMEFQVTRVPVSRRLHPRTSKVGAGIGFPCLPEGLHQPSSTLSANQEGLRLVAPVVVITFLVVVMTFPMEVMTIAFPALVAVTAAAGPHGTLGATTDHEHILLPLETGISRAHQEPPKDDHDEPSATMPWRPPFEHLTAECRRHHEQTWFAKKMEVCYLDDLAIVLEESHNPTTEEIPSRILYASYWKKTRLFFLLHLILLQQHLEEDIHPVFEDL